MDDPGLQPTRLTIEYPDGKHTFTRVPMTDDWVLKLEGVEDSMPLVTGYTPPDMMRVISNFLGTKEIAP